MRSALRVLTAAAASAVREKESDMGDEGGSEWSANFSVCHRQEREIWSQEIRG